MNHPNNAPRRIPTSKAILAGALAAASLLPTIRAQSPDAARPTAALRDSARLGTGIEQTPTGSLRALGPDYQATFEGGGMTFLPALGAEVPRDLPLHFETGSIRRGAQSLSVDRYATPRAESTDAVTFDRAPNVLERHVIRPDGVEMTWRFDSKPSGHGDLTVRGVIRSDLEPADVGRNLEQIRFGWNGADLGVRIGSVLGVDAAGREVPGSMHFDGTNVEFVLPHAFVESATYPMILDPLVGSLLQVHARSDTNTDTAPDAAYEESSDTFLVVWRRRFSASSAAIRGQRISGADGSRIGGVISISPSGGAPRDNPAVGSCRLTKRFLVAWPESNGGREEIRAINVGPDGSRGSLITVTRSSGNCSSVVAGSDATLSDDEVILVWIDDSQGVRAAQVTTRSDGSLLVLDRKTVDGNTNATKPAICKSGGAVGRYAVTWEAGAQFIGARGMTRNLGMLSASGFVSAEANQQVSNPVIAGDGQNFLIAYQQTGPGGHDIWGINLLLPAVITNLWSFNRKGTIEADVNDDERQPSICMGQGLFTVAWSDSNANYDIGLVNVTTGAFERSGFERFISGTGGDMTNPVLVSKRDGVASTTPDTALDAIYCVFEDSNNNGDIRAHLYETFRGRSARTIAPACGAVGQLLPRGPYAFGNSSFAFDLRGAASGSTFAALNIGLPGVPTINCAGCTIINPIVTLPATISNGSSAVPLPVTRDPRLNGLELDFQMVVVTNTGVTCVPNVGWSEVLRLIVVE